MLPTVLARLGLVHTPTCNAIGSAVDLARRLFSSTQALCNESESPSSNTTTAAPQDTTTTDEAPRLVVFGGNGYVGSHVCQAALQSGLQVLAISRSGTPASGGGAWTQDVEWYKGDALQPEQWRWVMQGALGVVSCVGAFGSNEYMLKVNGDANAAIAQEAAAAGVPRMAYISAHDYQFPGAWHVSDFLLKGYFQGKKAAEAALFAALPEGGVALRPGFIYGTRRVNGMPLPLGLVGAPLEAVLKLLPTRSLASVPIVGASFVPPVSVEAVGRAAVAAATDPAVPPGVMDVWTIQAQYSS